MFKKIFIDLCNEKRVAPTKVCKEIGLSNATFSCWTDESIPHRATLQRMADYFGVSIDLLLGKEARPTAAVISGRESEEKMLLNEILKKIKNACEGEEENGMSRKTMTDYEVEQEIKRLKESPLVALGKQEQRLIYKRRQYMYNLQWLERRGRDLSEMGITMENIEDQITRTDAALGEADGE